MNDARSITAPLFPAEYRASGLLLHVTSLPSPFGIGDLGPSAFDWIDRLQAAGQRWWQALPLGPTGCHNSPYQCLSSFAGNGLLISPALLVEDGLLQPEECAEAFSPTAVDYDVVIPFKHRLLVSAWTRFRAGARKDLVGAYEEFCKSRAAWLEDYALFRALKSKYNGIHYLQWPSQLVERVPSALEEARRRLTDEIDRVRLAQFLLFRQARRLKEHARANNVKLIGDLPFFVSPDSSDVWTHPELFLLDDGHRPRFLAGVPPDCFSNIGQLWGNPVYDWDAHRRSGYSWWIERILALLLHVDVIRLDHFRAFAAAWQVPAEAATAEIGEWVPGPGAAFFDAVRSELGALPFIAEDLGMITPDVSELRENFHIPGTRVLQFAFDGNPDNDHLPCNYPANTVAYTGTHDNATVREWFEGLTNRDQRRVWTCLQRNPGEAREAAPELIRLAWSSAAALAMAPLQDVLNLGREARMNVPGRLDRNWRWRATRHVLSASELEWLGDLTSVSKRLASLAAPVT